MNKLDCNPQIMYVCYVLILSDTCGKIIAIAITVSINDKHFALSTDTTSDTDRMERMKTHARCMDLEHLSNFYKIF